MVSGIPQGNPNLSALDSTVLNSDVRDEAAGPAETLSGLSYGETLWNDFFSDFYGYVSHRDVMSGGKNNYFVDIFLKQLKDFKKDVIPTKSYANKLDTPTSQTLNEVAADWKIHLEENKAFMLQTRNVMFWVFKILQETLLVLEDSLVNKSGAIKIPERAIAAASKILREDPRGKLEVPKGADPTYIPVVSMFIPIFDPPDRSEEFRVTHHNALAKVFRDDIRTHRGIAQKNFGLAAQRGGTINTAIQDHAGILKAVARMNDGLVKSILSKLKA